MPLSPLDAAFPAIEHLEKEVKLLKKELKQLKIAHDAVSNRLDSSLLDTQRILAKFMVVADGRYYIDLVWRKLSGKALAFESQVLTDIGSTRGKIDDSEKPLQLYKDFHDKCTKRIKNMGIQLLDLD